MVQVTPDIAFGWSTASDCWCVLQLRRRKGEMHWSEVRWMPQPHQALQSLARYILDTDERRPPGMQRGADVVIEAINEAADRIEEAVRQAEARIQRLQ